MKKVTFVLILLIGIMSFSLNVDKIVLAGTSIFDYEAVTDINIGVISNFDGRDFKPYISFKFNTENKIFSYEFYINTRSINPTYRDIIDEDNYDKSGQLKDIDVKYQFLSNFAKQMSIDSGLVDVYLITKSILY